MREHVTHHGSCHCGAVQFQVDALAVIEALRCNCSICRKTGFLHMIVPRERVRTTHAPDALTTYTFNTHTAQHTFCRTCGVKPFYTPRSHPDGLSVNVNCIDGNTIEGLTIVPFNGQQWDDHIASLKAAGLGED